mmetsp:Transcript_10526/g.18701  ORF Transcript_10526/g.18701 Transcript_10526/m.18701 type:complete len:116 (-) Transcript_10526:167-514(-)|eukprot:CAMPEP_0201882686 /NCGR_PEP_ID=MMETSP0902-20130614/14349_1 /ASSEMBLY_ACC=CAM_ASM_000551 /TAXON_ID=420261 /ORGANISM="Thalassiosira antarctica, Strain CCMP982" /LENGTH=115 /DNA_ID=CAMNT_0048411269 /DNA_START=126 /DNA_END=473 /DNA_ORIENTATION=-
MPFWNRGSSEESQSQQSKDFTSGEDMSSFSSSESSFDSSGAGAMADIEQFSMALRQQMMIQTVINTLSDKAFVKCITGKPGDSLSGKEAACVNATVCKWLDTNEFITGRMQRKMG